MKYVDSAPPMARLEIFSDAVFGIIATLLILELKFPHLGNNDQAAILWELYKLIPELAAFTFTFFVLCIFWVDHYQFFHSLKKADWGLVWHNNLLLFWLTLIPFGTGLFGGYPKVPVMVAGYSAIMCLAALSFRMMVRHAYVRRDLCDDSVPLTLRRSRYRRITATVFAYAAATLLCAVSLPLAWAALVAVPLLAAVPLLRRGFAEAIEEN